MNRFECLPLLAEILPDDTLTITSLSSNARIWSKIWDRGPSFSSLNLGLCVGFSMGVSLAFPRRKVFALDSDGSFMLDISSLISVADANVENLVIVVFDNSAYARMGPTATSRKADLVAIAKGAGFNHAGLVTTLPEFEAAIQQALTEAGPRLIVAKVEAETERINADDRRMAGGSMKDRFVDRVRALPDYGALTAAKRTTDARS